MPGAIVRPQGFTFQPQYPPVISASNPLTKGLVDAVLPIGGRVVSLATEGSPQSRHDNWTDTNTPTVAYSSAGQAKKYNFGSSMDSRRNWVPLNQVKECTVLVYWLPGASASNSGAVFAYGSSTTNNPFLVVGWATGSHPFWRVQDSAATNQALTGTGGKLTIQSTTTFPHVQICTRSQSGNFSRAYVDGVLDINTTATTMGAWAADRTAVAVLLRAATALPQDVYGFHLALVWDRALSTAEIQQLSANPWAVFDAPPRTLFADAAASSGPTATLSTTLGALTLSGAGTVAVSASATPTLGALTLSGTGTIPIAGALSGTLGALTLSGAAVVAVNATASNTLGALTLSGAGTVAISGTTTATFDPLTLSGSGAIAITATMSQTLGALTLSGSATVADGPSGSLSSSFDALTLTGIGNITGVGTEIQRAGGKTGPKAGPFRGPYDLSKRRWLVRDTKRQEDEAHKALLEAQQALEAAQEATKAKARQEAIAKVFRSLEAINGAESEIQDAKAAIAEAQGVKAIKAELQDLERLIKDAMDEVNELRRKRRQEEEDFVMMLLLN